MLLAGKEQCSTPDSPEGARVIAPRSPMSPHHVHPVNTMIPAANNRSSSVNRHNSASPTANGTPPPTVTPALLANSSSTHDSQRLLKIRRFLGALVQFGQDTNADVGDRLRSLVLSLAVSWNLFWQLNKSLTTFGVYGVVQKQCLHVLEF